MNPQLDGIDKLSGTYIFDVRVCNKRLNINRFFWKMINAEWRDRFYQNPTQLMQEANLTEYEQKLVTDQDWIGMLQHGVNFFVLEKYARVVKKTNLEVYALMCGKTYEEFMQTRQVPGAT